MVKILRKNTFLGKILFYLFFFAFIFFIFPLFVVNFSGSLNVVSSKSCSEIVNEKDTGIWFSFIEWENLNGGKNEEDWKKKVDEIIEKLKSLKINNVYVHAISHSDTFYKSDLYPMSKIILKNGKSVDYDPFRIFVDKLKENKFKVHAWINPLRGMFDEDYNKKISDSYQTKKWYIAKNRKDYYMKDKSGRYWLNPANKEVRNFIKKAIEEIITKYNNIDGIHIDDYFYPAGLSERNVIDSDEEYFKKHNSKKLDIKKWRRENITELIKIFYETCSKHNKVFGVSPQGNMNNNLNNMFFDQEEIIKKGYLDYIMPQIYFGFKNKTMNFCDCVKKWEKIIKKNKPKNKKIDFYVGLAAYKCGMQNDIHAKDGRHEWKNNSDILKRQVCFLNSLKDCEGFTFFSYESFFNPKKEVEDIVKKEKENLMKILN